MSLSSPNSTYQHAVGSGSGKETATDLGIYASRLTNEKGTSSIEDCGADNFHPETAHRLLADLDFGGHAVFSRRGRAVLLLPIRSRQVAAATIDLYRPQTAKAKLAVAALKLANRIGVLGLLPRLSGHGSMDCGALLCNPSHGTRFIAIRRADDHDLEVVKAACLADAAPLVSEHASLSRLNGRPGVPPVGELHRTEEAAWFTMPHLRPASETAFPVALLRAWESKEREPAENNGLIHDLLRYLDRPTRESLSGMTVRRTLVHGDFAPWNWRADANGNPVCIDWEWAREDGFAGFDLVYCLVQQALLVRKVRAEDLASTVCRNLAGLGSEAQNLVRESGLSLDTLLALVLAYRKSKGMEKPNSCGGCAPCSPQPPPRFLAFEGADGVGKSTVMRLLVPEIVRRGGYRGYLFFHWKPVRGDLSFDAIPGDNPHDPRSKSPRNPLASLVFLAHHWIDFLVGYWRFVRPALRAGRLVVADRYTYDVLLDPTRFRLRLPRGVLRLFVRTLPRPDRAILLHASPAVIHARKPELSEPEIDAYQAALLSCPLIRAPLAADASRTPQEIVNDLLRRLLSNPEQDAFPETPTAPTTLRESEP